MAITQGTHPMGRTGPTSFLLRLLEAPPRWLAQPVQQKQHGVVYQLHRLLEPGMCWYGVPAGDGSGRWTAYADGPKGPLDVATRWVLTLAPEHREKRPMLVVLPNYALFCLQQPTISQGGYGRSGWQVSGELPRVTVHPSIDHKGAKPWHGWLRQGVLQL